MIRAAIINAWHQRFRHPAAVARRVESDRARTARKAADAVQWAKVQRVATLLRIGIARERGEG